MYIYIKNRQGPTQIVGTAETRARPKRPGAGQTAPLSASEAKRIRSSCMPARVCVQTADQPTCCAVVFASASAFPSSPGATGCVEACAAPYLVSFIPSFLTRLAYVGKNSCRERGDCSVVLLRVHFVAGLRDGTPQVRVRLRARAWVRLRARAWERACSKTRPTTSATHSPTSVASASGGSGSGDEPFCAPSCCACASSCACACSCACSCLPPPKSELIEPMKSPTASSIERRGTGAGAGAGANAKAGCCCCCCCCCSCPPFVRAEAKTSSSSCVTTASISRSFSRCFRTVSLSSCARTESKMDPTSFVTEPCKASSAAVAAST
eukprot:scaffold24755_cov63-Phaeocystis_antarctica.AAC.3